MKKIAFLIILLTGIMLVDACKKAETDPQLNMNLAVKPAMTAPSEGSSIVLTAETASDMVAFSWSAAEYNLDDLAFTQYVIQMDFADSSFNKAKKVATTTETSFNITQAEFNSTLIAMGFSPGEAAGIKFRINASLNSYDDGATISGTVLESTPISAMVTPYETEGPPEYPRLWVPGAYQGWAPDVAPGIYSVEDDGMYSGYVYFPADAESFEFKFTSDPNWDGTNYGSGAEAGTLDTDSGAGNLSVSDAGTYFFTADINALTWTNELRNFALVGNFTNWGDDPDIALTWDAENTVWSVTLDLAADAEFKWRANSDWAFNYGLNDPDDGKLVKDGANVVPGVAGNYTINLYLYEAFPRYELILN